MSFLPALFSVAIASAQAIPPGISDKGVANGVPFNCDFLNGNATFACIPGYISNITFVVMTFTATVSLLMLIINGYRYMLGPVGPEQSSDAAKKGILYALVGLVVSLLAYIIIETIITQVTS